MLFSFGIGAFETISVEEGKLLFLEQHLNRLDKALNFLHLGNKKRGVLKGKSPQPEGRRGVLQYK